MTRASFLKMCSLLGVALPMHPVLNSCNGNEPVPGNFSGSVLVIGAGAAGLTAGYLLRQHGVKFQILEAAPTYGGRMKRNSTFTDFPIPLGAEWLHVSEVELKHLVNDPSVQIATELKGYQGREQVGFYENGVLSFASISDAFGRDFIDQKFINATWFDFFETYIVPNASANIQLNTEVVSINYQAEKLTATDRNGNTFEADKIIVTVPLKILQDEVISFTPALPLNTLEAIQKAPIWGGIKVFLEFSEKFYPVFLGFPDSETDDGQRLYYDAAYGQNTKANILGLFAVGKQAESYQRLSGISLRNYILEELDQIFSKKPSSTYIKHIVQNWNDEPFIRAAYLADNANSDISSTLAQTINDKIYFAGDAFTREDDWGAVHNAVRSARDVVMEIISNP